MLILLVSFLKEWIYFQDTLVAVAFARGNFLICVFSIVKKNKAIKYSHMLRWRLYMYAATGTTTAGVPACFTVPGPKIIEASEALCLWSTEERFQ